MPQQTNVFNQIISEICQEEGIVHQILSRGWIQKLQKADQTRYIVGHKFGLNPQSSSLIADDKYATFAALQSAGLPIIEHALLYDFSNQATYAEGCNSLKYVEDYLIKHNSHIVVKPNNGTLGRDVCYIQSTHEILPAMKQVFRHAESASLCPFYQIKVKYRFVVLDQEVRLAFSRQDGCPKRHTLTSGQVFQDLSKIALATAQSLNLRFCSVDFIQVSGGEIKIIEVNSGVMLRHYVEHDAVNYQPVKDLYRDAVLRMFVSGDNFPTS